MLPIADNWYKHKRLNNETTLIFEPAVHPFLRCNIWHIRGRDQDLLIDTGLGVSPLKPAIEHLIDKPLAAIATHIHYDHVGCLHEFDTRMMHRVEAPRMENYDEFCWLKLDQFPKEFHDALQSPEYDEYLISSIPTADFDIDDYRIQSTTATRILDEGDIVDLGDRHLEVFHLPGHSPGSIGLWDEASATLYAGDALYDGELLDELPDSSIPDYINTMKRLRQLPVTTVHGGHEPSFGRDRMIELIDQYLDWREG